MISARSSFLEHSVRGQNGLLGEASQKATDLGVVESQFDLTSTFGVSTALNDFFNGVSRLAVNPNDTVARQSVIDLADQAATAFNQSARGLQRVSIDVDRQTRDTVNGMKDAPGGYLDMGGPTIAGGMMFMHTGYNGSAGANNMLLAFTVDGK